MTDAERFWARVDKSGGPLAHWPWRGKREFVLARARRPMTACAWILTYGGLPVDKRVIHTEECNNPNCANPAHMQLGTCADLVRRVHNHPNRGGKKGSKWSQPALKCKEGHVYTEATVFYRSDGYRRCVLCHRAQVARWRRNDKERREREAQSPLMRALLEGAREK